MSLSATHSGVEIGEHPRFEVRWRRLQMIVFSTFAALALAGLCGLLGAAPWSRVRSTTVGSPSTIDYARFARARAPEQLIVRGGAPSHGPLRLHLDRALVEALGVESIFPAPLSSAATADGVEFTFAATGGTGGPILVKEQPQRPGLIRGRLTLDGVAHDVTQIVWP